jgi:hypothetical protein
MEGVNLRYTVSTFVNVTLYPHYKYDMLINKKTTETNVSVFQ